MARHDWVFQIRNDPRAITRQIAPGVTAEIFVGERAMLSLVRLDPHAESQVHSHAEEQWGIMLEGEAVRFQGDVEANVQVGDFWLTPGTVPHAVRAGEHGAVVLDVFSPPRPEYRVSFASDADPLVNGALDLEQSLEVGVAALSDSGGGTGVFPSSIRSMTRSNAVAGPALTVSCSPRDNYWVHRAVSAASPGDVLVVSTGRYPDAGYWGEILTRAALARGIRGLVIDGCIRDLQEVDALGFPAFGTGTCVRQTSKSSEFEGSFGRPIHIGECVIRTADWIIGDRDGVIVLPRDQGDAILASARQRVSGEHDSLRRIEAGESTLTVLGIKGNGGS